MEEIVLKNKKHGMRTLVLCILVELLSLAGVIFAAAKAVTGIWFQNSGHDEVDGQDIAHGIGCSIFFGFQCSAQKDHSTTFSQNLPTAFSIFLQGFHHFTATMKLTGEQLRITTGQIYQVSFGKLISV